MKKKLLRIMLFTFIASIAFSSNPVKAGPWGDAIGGALLGAAIGGLVGGGDAARAGALVGGGAGLAVGAAKNVRRKRRAQEQRARIERERLEWEKIRVQAEMRNREEIIRMQERERALMYSSDQPHVPGAASVSATNVSERLRELDNLRFQGLISASEYQAKRAEILRGL